jgi:arginine-tRNA-protein transferase
VQHSSATGSDPIPPVINDVLVSIEQTPEEMDRLWRDGWRHFGPMFFRYSYTTQSGPLQTVQPLRVVLEHFAPRKTHRRLLRRNQDLRVTIQPPNLDEERHRLFELHKSRFEQNVPDSLFDFLGPYPALYPCEYLEVAAWLEGRLIAASYIDIGREGASGVYAIFDPAHSARGLGITTMLWEMTCARERGCRYYYPGYGFHEASLMDYKKQFPGTEWYDWRGHWRPLPRGVSHPG